MLDGLRGGEEARVDRGRTLVVLGDFVAFLDDAVDGGALFAFSRLADLIENLLKTFDLALGLPQVLLERVLQFAGLCRLRHLRQRLQDLVFRVINVLQGVEE